MQTRIILFILILVNVFIKNTESECVDCINIGGLFDQEILETKGAFRLAMEHHNRNASSESQVYFLVGVIRTRDAFKIAKLVCRQFFSGVWAMVGSVEPDSFDTLHSYANTFQMPLVTPWFPENVGKPSSGFLDYALSLRPDYHKAIVDLVHHYEWRKIIYLYDSHDGLLRLQDLFMAMEKSNASFSIHSVQRIWSSSGGLSALRKIEMADRWSNKYVILDAATELTKDLIIRHVQDVSMGRRNYHYLLAGLVMDARWESDIREFGAINITGFRLVDDSRPFVQQFLYNWRALNEKEYPGAGEYISARSALMYDAVRVMTEALNIFIKQNPQSVNLKSYQKTICDLKAAEPKVFPYGEAIARVLRKVSIEGLTGNISFNEEGRRKKFSLDVVEMTTDVKAVKVGTWSDSNGLSISSMGDNDRNKLRDQGQRLKITTIYEKPFLMRRHNGSIHGNWEGYIRDLINLLSLKVGFNYTIQLVRDNHYGARDDSYLGGWNGMIGEVIRGEADLAVAPLTITSSREQFVDFTKPFMATGISMMGKRPNRSQHEGMFFFMKPFSGEVWICTCLASIGVVFLQYVLSKFDPREYGRIVVNNTETLKHNMSLENVIWRTLGTLFQQETGVSPKSAAGRIVSITWWIYAMVIVCSYTAYVAAIALSKPANLSVANVHELVKQDFIAYGMMKGGATSEFFQRSKIQSYSRLWEKIEIQHDSFTKNYEEGIKNVKNSKGNYVFLLEKPMNKYVNHQTPCDTIQIGEELSSSGYGIATQIGSQWTEKLNIALLELSEEGHLTNLQKKWWNDSPTCAEDEYDKQETPQLKIQDISGLFFFLSIGMGLGMVAAGIESVLPKEDIEDYSEKRLEILKGPTKYPISINKDLDNGRAPQHLTMHCTGIHNQNYYATSQNFQNYRHPQISSHNTHGSQQRSTHNSSTPNSCSQVSFCSSQLQFQPGLTSQEETPPSSPKNQDSKPAKTDNTPCSSVADLPF